MSIIAKNEVRANLSYYKRLLIMSEIGGQTPQEIAVQFDHPEKHTQEQIATDLTRLKQTIESETLSEDLAAEFNEVYATREQIEAMEGITLSDTPGNQLTDSQRQQIDQCVAQSLIADEKTGFSPDLVSEWFYRRVHQERLIQEQA
ncbi:hypothetical protein PM035_14245 [Halorubrum ezzemoulense]|uniref:hypothetical protein n=1 Tax=Halorubrum ezzemoulense TaxID=337243 RepID=UPI00232B75A7|nr:hypothetical protein [Halorubrum ezzemoulense]MDB2262129.1 hypothetical protein [Halorubrum ezzemoulense]MDB2268844.1 hypothetical protein [Halorubrum ezzemoulense]